MLDLAGFHRAVLLSAELWAKGQNSEALAILDEWIGRAQREDETAWVDMACSQASMIAKSMGDLRRVRHYCEQILSHENEATIVKALALYKMADAMFDQGEVDLARQAAARSYALVAHPASDEDRGLLELLVKAWPEIVNWKA